MLLPIVVESWPAYQIIVIIPSFDWAHKFWYVASSVTSLWRDFRQFSENPFLTTVTSFLSTFLKIDTEIADIKIFRNCAKYTFYLFRPKSYGVMKTMDYWDNWNTFFSDSANFNASLLCNRDIFSNADLHRHICNSFGDNKIKYFHIWFLL